MQSWLEGRIWVGKGAQATGMTASLRIQSSKADSNTWESFTRSGLKLESVHQESSRSDVFRKRATKPFLKQRQRQMHLTWAVEKKNWTVAQWSKVLFSDESKFCISFGNQGPRIWRKSGEAQNPCCLKSSVKFPQSVMIWAAMSSAGVGPLCFLKSTVNAAIYQAILAHFMLPSADKLYGDADFIFQQDLAPAHTAKGTLPLFLLKHTGSEEEFIKDIVSASRRHAGWTSHSHGTQKWKHFRSFEVVIELVELYRISGRRVCCVL